MPDGQMRQMDWIMLISLSLLWGAAFVLTEIALDDAPAITVVLARVGFGAALLWSICLVRRVAPPLRLSVWTTFFVMGALNNALPFALIVWGQTGIEAGLAAILNATTPLFTFSLAYLLAKTKHISRAHVIGLGLGFCGVIILVGPESLTGLGGHGLHQGAVLLAALSYALAGLYGRRLIDLGPLVASTGMLTAATVIILPFAIALAPPWNLQIGALGLVALLVLAWPATAIAYLLYFSILRSAGPANLLLVTFLIPVSALVMGVLLLGEDPSWNAYAGLTLILGGLVTIDGRVHSPGFWRRFKNLSQGAKGS